MTESITRIRGTGPSPFGIMLTLLKIRLSSLLFTSPPFATSIFLRLSCLCNSSLFLADLLQSFSNLCAQTRTFTYDAHTHFLILSLSFSFSLRLLLSWSPIMHRARLSLSLPPRWWNIRHLSAYYVIRITIIVSELSTTHQSGWQPIARSYVWA